MEEGEIYEMETLFLIGFIIWLGYWLNQCVTPGYLR
jgi:hypothetical protein